MRLKLILACLLALSTTDAFVNAGTLSAAESGKVPGLSDRMPGVVKVESNGPATYSIPIRVPPPTAGLGPNIAFVYNSQGGNGWLGMGWSISGLPVIDRCPRTLAQDGFAGAVNLDTNDRFCMDGARLRAVNGADGEPETVYRTEVDKFVKVVSKGSVAGGSGPQYFIAQTKDGLTMEFGNSSTSAIQAQGKTPGTYRLWALSKLKDKKGNYLTVTYTQVTEQGHYRPDRIDYTFNDGGGVTTATRSVRFTPETRTDVWSMYLGGSVITIPERITHVTTYVGETPVRDYVLQYEYGTATKRSRLKSVTECAGGTCMPPHVFDWQEGGNGAYTPVAYNYPNVNFSPGYVWPGDYDGNGKIDLATIENGRLYTYFSNGDGTFSMPNVYDFPNNKFTALYVWPGDYNSDGKTDLATVEGGKLYTYLSNGDGTYNLIYPDGYNYPNGNFTPGYVWPGDYDSDGKTDLATSENGRLYVYLSNGDGTYVRTPHNSDGSYGYNYPNGNFSPGYVWPGDYNSDGKMDLATSENGRLYLYLSKGDGTFDRTPHNSDGSYGFNYPNGNFSASHVWPGDYNSDGKTDLATQENGWLYTYFSKGDGNFEKAAFNYPNANFAPNYVWAVDYNGDGKTDLASRESGDLYTYFSRGDGQYDKVPYDYVSSAFTADRVWAADYKGHGKSDWASSDGGILYTYISNGPYPDLLVKITNPFQGKNEITYKPLTDGSVYAKDTLETAPQYVGVYPNIDAQWPLYVVSNLTVSDSHNNYAYTYTYGGAKVNLLGRGWLGFRTMEVFDSSAGSRQKTFYHQYFPKTGLPHIQETERTNGDLMLDIEYKYCDPVNDLAPCPESYPGVKQVLMKRMETDEREGEATTGRLTAKTFEHDTYGNLTLTKHEGIVSATQDEREEETQWAMNVDEWLFRPKTTILREPTETGMAIRRQKWLYYDNLPHGSSPTAGFLTTEEIDADAAMGSFNNPNPTFTYTYDNFGNRQTVTDPRNCVTKTTFETDHNTYPLAVTACDNLSSPKFTTNFEYWPEHGGIKKQTDTNGASTTFLYDPFGRPTRVTNQIDADSGSPNGTESYSYPDWGTPAQRVVVLKTKDHGQSGVIETEHYFDGFGRVDVTSTDGPEPADPKIVVQIVYDSRGLATDRSVPRFNGETAKWTHSTYDARGRETELLHPDGTSVTKVYTPGQVTITDQRGKQKIQIFDAYGRLKQVQEKSGLETFYTDYTYDAAGALKTTINHLDHVTSMDYDLAGRKTFMQDPNMGDWRYEYFPSGDLKLQTDAKNQTLCFAYDPLGRSTAKWQGQTNNCGTVVANLVSWTYDETVVPNAQGRLTTVIDQPGSSESRETRFLAYDKLGRVTQTQRTIDGVVPYTLTQTFDALSRIKSETFSDEPAQPISYTYNNAGWLKSVTGYITEIKYNPRGQKTEIHYGNGVVSNLTYDDTDATPSFRLQRRQTDHSEASHTTTALNAWVRSWTVENPLAPPAGYSNLYAGGICVRDGAGNCIGGDAMMESGVGSVIGFLKNSGGAGTVPVYRSTCYSSGASCAGWGLSLDVNGTAVGYLATTAPDGQSAAQPFIQSNGLLLQGLSGTASAYLWSLPTQTVNHTDHVYLTTGAPPNGYTPDGTTGYIDNTSFTGTVALVRYVNASTGHHYYSTASDPPSGFASEATVGYLHTTGGSGLTALYRHYNSTTSDYLLSTSSGPPSGYALQATLGYLHTTTGPSGSYQDLTYQFDNGGNITGITDALWTGGRSFVYDDLNRLTSATGNFGSNLALVTHNYAYDAIGNILNKAGVLYYYCTHPQQPAASQYCGGPLHPSAVVNTSDGNVYTYDDNGNTWTGAGRDITWTVDNRVERVTAPGGSADMLYDYTGSRVKKSGSGDTTYFPFAGYEVTGAVYTKYIRVGNETLAAKKGGEMLFYHNDHLGGVNVITNIFRVTVQLDEYDPWGKVSRSEGNVDETKRFTGKELDPESGLYYYGGRYYDPQLARFVSPDPFIQSPGNPQNFNRYSYTINNPQIYIDPSGHFFWMLLSALTSKDKSGSVFVNDPISFILSKLPKKANAGIQIFGGVVMMITGNPAGALVVASGALSFGKGNGFQIASQVLGIAGTIAGLYHSYGPGTAWSSESGGTSESTTTWNSGAQAEAAQPGTSGVSRNPEWEPYLKEPQVQKTLKDSLDITMGEGRGGGLESGGNFLRWLFGSRTAEINYYLPTATYNLVQPLPPTCLTCTLAGQFHVHPYDLGLFDTLADYNKFVTCSLSECGSFHVIVTRLHTYAFSRTSPPVDLGPTSVLLNKK